jgi:hypothetical protein
VSLREPGDALVSMYRFMEGWFLEPGTVLIEEFARGQFLSRADGEDYWAHLLSWWNHRRDPNVLLLSYEGMLEDPPGTIRRVAAFIDVPLDEELLELMVRQSSLEFMTEFKDRFDDKLMRERSEQVAGLPVDSDSAKVRTGVVGARKIELSPQIQAELDDAWREKVESATGLVSYEALLQALKQDSELAAD